MKQTGQVPKKMTQTQAAQKRFELENEIIDEEKTYHWNEDEI